MCQAEELARPNRDVPANAGPHGASEVRRWSRAGRARRHSADQQADSGIEDLRRQPSRSDDGDDKMRADGARWERIPSDRRDEQSREVIRSTREFATQRLGGCQLQSGTS